MIDCFGGLAKIKHWMHDFDAPFEVEVHERDVPMEQDTRGTSKPESRWLTFSSKLVAEALKRL
jgi:hypothetical protein